jgi:hypothetical protein
MEVYMIVRCKMRVNEVTHSLDADGSVRQERVKLYAVTSGSDENKEWAKYTPWANFEIGIDNPEAMNKLSQGHEFYVDLTPAGALVSKS